MGLRAALSVLFLSAVVSHVQAPPRSVEEAEAEGAKHPGAAPSAERSYPDPVFGSSERRCVDAETHLIARSGEFTAGNFQDYISMAGTGKRKVWWAPRGGGSKDMPPLRLRGTKLGAPATSVDWTLPSIASTSAYFFNSQFVFPENGKWLVVATSGNNWGCFLLTEIHAPK